MTTKDMTQEEAYEEIKHINRFKDAKFIDVGIVDKKFVDHLEHFAKVALEHESKNHEWIKYPENRPETNDFYYITLKYVDHKIPKYLVLIDLYDDLTKSFVIFGSKEKEIIAFMKMDKYPKPFIG